MVSQSCPPTRQRSLDPRRHESSGARQRAGGPNGRRGFLSGSTQPLPQFVRARAREPAFNQVQSFTLACWLYPTTPHAGVAGLLGTWSGANRAALHWCRRNRALAIWLGGSRGEVVRVSVAQRCELARGTSPPQLDAERGPRVACPTAYPGGRWTRAMPMWSSRCRLRAARTNGPFLMAALGRMVRAANQRALQWQLEAPCLFGAAPRSRRANALGRGEPPGQCQPRLSPRGTSRATRPRTRVTDVSPAGLHGETVQALLGR
jgi:hypothetical protein